MLKIGCVVMAAGNARRFGDNKLAAQLRGRSLILRALEAVPAEMFDSVVVVTQYPEIIRLVKDFHFASVHNQHPDWGISHTHPSGADGAAGLRWGHVSGQRPAPAGTGERGGTGAALETAAGQDRGARPRRRPGAIPASSPPGCSRS